ncbi:hypothetical protein FACS1894187_23350 [Synergistales bacterium]|nr:hypothetical protein FACS1894187_23350 [Synergistales bacterium]
MYTIKIGNLGSNFFKDTWGAAINSENPFAIPIVDNIKGIIFQFSKNPEIQKYVDEFKENGRLYAGITEIKKNTPKNITNAVRRAFEEGNPLQKTGDLIMRGLELWGSANEISELAPKITEYIYLRTKKNMPIKEAVMRAREVNINFQRIDGQGMQRASRITSFMNANIQGVDKFA